jgi:predicted Fe-S protein YdhL (DUF1289 family)
MSDEVWKRQEIESPCIKLCVIHPETRLCAGCYRSIDEIAGWGSLSPEARSAIMAALPQRGQTQPGRRGGRQARLARSRKGTASGG